jgi:hypothetical protein
LNTHTQGSVLVVNHPAGGNFGGGSGGMPGAIKIQLPVSWSNSMLRFYVEIYEYQSGTGGGFSATYEVGGYNYGGAYWVNAYAKMVGTPAAQRTVRFGHDGTYCCIWIGDPGGVWEYPQVIVSNLRVGFNNYAESQWKSGWAVSLDTSAVSGHSVTMTEASPLTGASWPLIAGTGRPADNATVGAAWGSNITGQPSDAALLNANQQWAQVSGTGRPADNATVNRLTYSGTGPGSPVDGDIWVDTSATPNLIKVRVSAAWQTGANLSTGALAQLNAVNTGQITAGAVTTTWDLAVGVGPYTRTNVS